VPDTDVTTSFDRPANPTVAVRDLTKRFVTDAHTDERRLHLGRATRKVLLVTHLLSSVGWFGAATIIVVLVVGAGATGDGSLVHAYVRSAQTAVVVTLVLGLLAIATGTVLSLGTRWGLLLHWWIVTKIAIALVVVATDAVIVRNALDAAAASGHVSGRLYGPAFAHVVVLAAAVTISVFKPWGRTPRGLRLRAGR
jgi:hypothetical protein